MVPAFREQVNSTETAGMDLAAFKQEQMCKWEPKVIFF